MFYIGKWREVNSGEVISINEHLGGDRYCLDYCSDDGKVIKSEDVQILYQILNMPE